MTCKRIILFAVLGLFLAIVFLKTSEADYFERWEKLPTVSDEVISYFSITDNEFEHPPCDYSSPEFSFLSNSPDDVADCAQYIIWYPEGSDRNVYVLDSEGNLWVWSHRSVLNFYLLILAPINGVVFGAIIAILTTKPAQKVEPQLDNANR